MASTANTSVIVNQGKLIRAVEAGQTKGAPSCQAVGETKNARQSHKDRGDRRQKSCCAQVSFRFTSLVASIRAARTLPKVYDSDAITGRALLEVGKTDLHFLSRATRWTF
jgi:hypothetical protein